MSRDVDAIAASLRFGRFELDPVARTLFENGKPVTLGARAFDLLTTLASRPGELVTKREILTSVWPGLVVEENNIQVQVSTLRKLLGASALSTIPGRGYRFETPIDSRGAATRPPAPGGGPTQAGQDSRSNLPASAPPLFGRAGEVEAIGQLVRSHALVTVVGAGGMGKTRVAQAVAMQARDARAHHPDGVWWVELATLSDGRLIAASIAHALGMTLPQDRDPDAALTQLLAHKEMLLALDNCEHVSDAVASLVSALRAAAPLLRLLVTSQETLKVAEEHVYRIGSLGLPDDDADGIAQSGAVALFVARAQAAEPSFALTPANSRGVVEICRRLDGIPLAIEFAAARIPLLGVEGLRTRLHERFNLLTGGARVVLRRHQTLRATLEWSHALLTADEQTVFRRLAIFAGSFTLEAAQHVATDDAIDPWAALDHLGALVDKSLVVVEGDPAPRYRMLETTRAYALERLAEAHETQPMLRRHAEATLAALAPFRAVDWHWRANTGELREAATEIDNVRAALAWAAGSPEGRDLVVPLAAASFCAWWSVGNMAEGLSRCIALRSHVDADTSERDAAAFWLATARLGNYSVRRESYDAAVTAARMYDALGDEARRFDALTSAAVQGVRFVELTEVEDQLAQAALLERPEWPPRQRACLEFARCWCYARQGRIEEALAAAQRQAAICRQGGVEVAELFAMSNVTAIEILVGRTHDALDHARASIARLEAVGAGFGAGHLYRSVALACALDGRNDDALAAARAGYRLLIQEGDQYLLLPSLALVAANRGRYDDAARIAAFHRSEHAQMPYKQDALATFVMDRLEPMLAREIAPAQRALRDAEGAALGVDAVFALALR